MTRTALVRDLAARAFASPGSGAPARRLGVEVELIPFDSTSGRRCPIEAESCLSTLPFLRSYGRKSGWLEGTTPKGTPCFTLPGGGSITFEPGGQLEYSSPPSDSAGGLLALLQEVVPRLRSAAGDEGIDLLAMGIDPVTPVEQVPLLLHAKRYQRMADYLARIGADGARMMRQTAAFQINIDFGEQLWLGWRVLNAAAPYLTAIFANSPIYAGEGSGFVSTRAQVWRGVDPARTGIPYDEDAPVEAYLDFALDAPAILLPEVDGGHSTFGERLEGSRPSWEEWSEHLSTLFPEVRPRGHFELRSTDTIDPQWYAAPVALVAGVLYDPRTLQAASDLLGHPDSELLDRAAREGLNDPDIARNAADLFELALQGCRSLTPGYFNSPDLEQATAFFEQYTSRGRSPAHDLLESAIAA